MWPGTRTLLWASVSWHAKQEFYFIHRSPLRLCSGYCLCPLLLCQIPSLLCSAPWPSDPCQCFIPAALPGGYHLSCPVGGAGRSDSDGKERYGTSLLSLASVPTFWQGACPSLSSASWTAPPPPSIAHTGFQFLLTSRNPILSWRWWQLPTAASLWVPSQPLVVPLVLSLPLYLHSDLFLWTSCTDYYSWWNSNWHRWEGITFKHKWALFNLGSGT